MVVRTAQRKRTRQALLAGARALLARGRPVTLADAAEEASISIATAYRYFSDPRVLAAEAALDIEVMPVERMLAGAKGSRERVHRVADYFRAMVIQHEAAFRAYMAATMEATIGQDPKRRIAIRGARRVDAFEAALADERSRLARDDLRDCVSALSGVTGIEHHIVMHDICGLDADAAARVARISVDAILDRFGVM